jgi:L-alanine-DL-glutamate epimerase-like enolase superfamily enzyme
MLAISKAKAYLCDLPVPSPRTDAMQAFLKQETVFVEIETADGSSGLGYSYTIGTGGSAILELLEGYLLAQIIGEDASRPEALWQKVHDSTRATMIGPMTALALAAIDTAAWDLRTRALGAPLWQLAGGAHEQVPLYDTEGGWLHLSADELATNAVAATARGFRGVKVKVGKPSAAEDLARLTAVREAIGPDTALMVDANQAFTRDEAVRRARLLEPLDLTWIEEPLPADDVRGHALLAAATSIPVAVGESLYSIGQFREYLAAGAASIIQPDVARIGGITPWLKAAHLAEAFDVNVAPHFLMELHLSLSAAVPNGRWVEWIPQLSALTAKPVETVDGRGVAPSSAGIGIAWDQAAIDEYRVNRAARPAS